MIGSYGEGWQSLIRELANKINQFISDYPEYKDLEISDIKEKWGGLRVHLSYYPPGIESIIGEYEEKSLKICEVCGKPGSLHNVGGWYKTLCDDCLTKYGN